MVKGYQARCNETMPKRRSRLSISGAAPPYPAPRIHLTGAVGCSPQKCVQQLFCIYVQANTLSLPHPMSKRGKLESCCFVRLLFWLVFGWIYDH
jgi:hypothetical protein